MIRQENMTIDGVELVRTYSDSDLCIIQDGTGIVYEEAVDPVSKGRTYTESDIAIVEEISDEEIIEELGAIL